MRRTLLALALAGFAHAAGAVFEPLEFSSAEHERRYRDLVAELRCLVCQNQNLADSNAELAADLRHEVYTMLEAGRSDEAIVDFLVARYGDFVRYRPPLRPATVLLWLGPFALALGALAGLVVLVRRRRAEPAPAPGPDARQRAAALLGGERER